MSPYLIYTDSAADMPAEAFRRHDIHVIPMDYMLDGTPVTFYTDSPDHDRLCRELFEAQRRGADVHTSQITPFRYTEIWEPELEAGRDILYICFSSGMSTTWQNACSAAEDLRKKYPERQLRVVDSLSATAGQGLLTSAAAINRDEHQMPLEENARWLEEHRLQVCHRFTVGDLDYLHRGGRISGAAARIGGLLEIKPLLIIDDKGELEIVGKVSGRHLAVRRLAKAYSQESGVPGVPDELYVGHTGNEEDLAFLLEKLREAVPPQTRIETIFETPIIGAHTGPWFLSVCGWGFHRKID